MKKNELWTLYVGIAFCILYICKDYIIKDYWMITSSILGFNFLINYFFPFISESGRFINKKKIYCLFLIFLFISGIGLIKNIPLLSIPIIAFTLSIFENWVKFGTNKTKI